MQHCSVICRLTKAHLQSVKYDAKHTVGLVQRVVFGNKELHQAKTTAPSAKKEGDTVSMTCYLKEKKLLYIYIYIIC